MKPACEKPENTGLDWHEALAIGWGLGCPGFFDIEWLIDRAEHGEWSGLWW